MTNRFRTTLPPWWKGPLNALGGIALIAAAIGVLYVHEHDPVAGVMLLIVLAFLFGYVVGHAVGRRHA